MDQLHLCPIVYEFTGFPGNTHAFCNTQGRNEMGARSNEYIEDMIPFFSKDEEVAIISAIQEAEKRTSGEIRVHVESKPRGETMDLAVRTFHRLKMHQTKERNGVLIFLAPESRVFAIIGDEGIDARVPDDFWEEVSHTMEHHFREHAFAKGVCAAIQLAGEKLQAYFPYAADDENELPDDISKA